MKFLRNLMVSTMFGTAFGVGVGQAMGYLLTITVS